MVDEGEHILGTLSNTLAEHCQICLLAVLHLGDIEDEFLILRSVSVPTEIDRDVDTFFPLFKRTFEL
jgi:hypothetical protein